MARADMLMSYMYCFDDWLIGCLYFDWCYSYTCTLRAGLSVWRLCCRLWHRGLSLWQPGVPPVDVGSSHWQHLSFLVLYLTNIHAIRSWPRPKCSCDFCSGLLWLTIDWLIAFISINATPKYVHWGRDCWCDGYTVACGTADCLCGCMQCHQ